LQSDPQECQGTGGVGAFQQTLVFAPEDIAPPMLSLATPVASNRIRQPFRIGIGSVEAGDKMSDDVRFLGWQHFTRNGSGGYALR